MTVRYRSATLGEFIEHHSYDVSRGGMFIKTPSPFPAGTLLKFEVKIAEEQRLMQGVGRVVWKREGDQAGDDAPAGMGIKFIKIDEASHAVIERLVENRGHGGPSAFDQSAPAHASRGPTKSQRMFPEHAPSSPPPAAEEAPPPPGLDGFELPVSSSPSIEAEPTEETVSESDAPSGSGPKVVPTAGTTKARAKLAKASKTSAGAPTTPRQPAGRRWFVAALLVLFVLAALYVLTHKAPTEATGALESPSATPGCALPSTPC
jgi:uncharacterized protein (TIGR02266 family)